MGANQQQAATPSIHNQFTQRTPNLNQTMGFASAGQAIAHQKEMNLSNAYTPLIISLNVAVPASRDEFNTFSASCSSEMAISLADVLMDSS